MEVKKPIDGFSFCGRINVLKFFSLSDRAAGVTVEGGKGNCSCRLFFFFPEDEHRLRLIGRPAFLIRIFFRCSCCGANYAEVCWCCCCCIGVSSSCTCDFTASAVFIALPERFRQRSRRTDFVIHLWREEQSHSMRLASCHERLGQQKRKEREWWSAGYGKGSSRQRRFWKGG